MRMVKSFNQLSSVLDCQLGTLPKNFKWSRLKLATEKKKIIQEIKVNYQVFSTTYVYESPLPQFLLSSDESLEGNSQRSTLYLYCHIEKTLVRYIVTSVYSQQKKRSKAQFFYQQNSLVGIMTIFNYKRAFYFNTFR